MSNFVHYDGSAHSLAHDGLRARERLHVGYIQHGHDVHSCLDDAQSIYCDVRHVHRVQL